MPYLCDGPCTMYIYIEKLNKTIMTNLKNMKDNMIVHIFPYDCLLKMIIEVYVVGKTGRGKS